MKTEFKTVTLGEIAMIHDSRRVPLNSRERNKRRGVFPYYGAQGVVDYIDDFIFDGDYVLVAEDGENLRSRKQPVSFRAKGKFWVNNHAHVVLGNEPWLNDYIEAFFHYTDISPYVTGAAQPKLNQANLLKIQIPYLEKAAKESAALWSLLQRKIELNRRMNETLEEMGQALFKKYFIDNPESEGWGKVVLGEVLTPQRGKSLTRTDMIDGLVPVVSGGLEAAGYHSESNTRAPVVTISASGANAGFVRLWHSNVWSADSSYIDKTVTDHVYLFYLFLKINQEKIYSMQTGAAQPHIYPSHLGQLEIPNIPKEQMYNFSKIVDPLFMQVGDNLKEIQVLCDLRDSLLPKLISGDIEV